MAARFLTFVLMMLPTFLAAYDLSPLETALQKQARHRSVSVAIRQTKKVPALTEEIVHDGHLWLQPSKTFRYELGKPLIQTAVFDGKQVHLIDETEKTARTLDPEDRRVKPLMLSLGIGEAASLERLLEHFTVTGTNRVDEHFIVSFTPKGNLRRALRSLVMQVNTRNSFPERIEWTQRDGTIVITEFFPPKIDQDLPSDYLQIKRENYVWE